MAMVCPHYHEFETTRGKTTVWHVRCKINSRPCLKDKGYAYHKCYIYEAAVKEGARLAKLPQPPKEEPTEKKTKRRGRA